LQTFLPYVKECEFSEKDFCVIENEFSEGMYVDLLENPEGYTGYSGPSATKIWDSIYKENCFMQAGAAEVCTEKRVFYRLISGMHASIGAHLSGRFFDRSTHTWVSFLLSQCFVLSAAHSFMVSKLRSSTRRFFTSV